MSVRVVVVIALLTLAVPAVNAEGAKPRWSAPQRISAPEGIGVGPEDRVPFDHFVLAGNARGDRLLTWPVSDGMMFSVSRRGARFGKPRRIASPWTPSAVIRAGLDAEGRAVILWSAFDDERQGTGGPDYGCCERLLGAVVRPLRKPRARKLSAPGGDAEYPAFAVAPSGRFGVVWGRAGRLQARFGSTRRGFGQLEEVVEGVLPFGIVLGTRRPRVAVAEGETLVEYSRRSAGAYTRGPAAAWDAHGSLFGSDARGREVLTRQEQHADFTGFLEVATRPPGGELTRQTVTRDAAGRSYEPWLDVAPTGAAVLAWVVEGKESDPERRRVRAVVRDPNGGFSSPRVVYTAPSGRSDFPPPLADVAAAPHGGAAIATIPGVASERPHVVLVTRRGRVRVSHAVPRVGSVEKVAVLADRRGTAVAWATGDSIFASATR